MCHISNTWSNLLAESLRLNRLIPRISVRCSLAGLLFQSAPLWQWGGNSRTFTSVISKLRSRMWVLHAAARFVAAIGPRDHVTPTLISLHWLLVHQRITYKLCTMMHSVFFGQAPSYISEIVIPVAHLSGRAHLR